MAPGSNKGHKMDTDSKKNSIINEYFADSILAYSAVKSEKKVVKLPDYSFTWLDIFIVLVSMGTYLADIVTDILVMLVYWKIDEISWAALTLTFLIVPAIIMQVFSTRWYILDGHQLTPCLVVIHLFLMGPIKRYISILHLGFRARHTKRIEDYQLVYSEMSDVSMLRLIECFLESAPQLVLQLYIMIRVEEGDHILTGISACFSLLSLSWAIVAYTKALRTAVSKSHRVSWAGTALQTMWRLGMVLGRITAIVLFATIYQEWTLLLLGLHWLLMSSWLVVQNTDFCNTWWEERLFNLIIGIIYVFCFFNMKEGKSRWRATFYYIVTFVENSTMIMLWWPQRTDDVWYNDLALVAVWGGFALGVLSMLLYYQYFHPASHTRCHCCMAWYKISYFCHHKQTQHSSDDVTPCKKGGRHMSRSNEFESTVSSEEELDYRDFTELRCSYATSATASHLPLGGSKACKKRLFNLDHCHMGQVDETIPAPKPQYQVAPNKQSGIASNDKENYETPSQNCDVIVVGDAKSGFKLKSVEIIAHKPSRNFFSLPRPNATSTPDEYLKKDLSSRKLEGIRESADNNKAVDLNQLCTTPKSHKPGSPNTLIKNWVRRNQEMYRNKDGCFAKSSLLEFDEKSMDADVITVQPRKEEAAACKKYPIRMKSFSKRDRQEKPVMRAVKRNRKVSFRNSFREAFGFHVIDLDKIQEHSPKNSKAKQKNVTMSSKQNINAIKYRKDEPSTLLAREKVDAKPAILSDEKQNKSVGDTFSAILASENKKNGAHEQTKQDSINLQLKHAEENLSEGLDCNSVDGRKLRLGNRTDAASNDDQARKKLAFDSKTVMHREKKENSYVYTSREKSSNVNTKKVLGSVENCM